MDILKIIDNNKFNNMEQLEKIHEYVKNIPQYKGYEDYFIRELSGNYLTNLYNQDLISNPKFQPPSGFIVGAPILLSGIAYGYLETTIKLEELVDSAITRMGITLPEQNSVRTKLMAQVKDLGIDFLIKLIIEAAKNSFKY